MIRRSFIKSLLLSSSVIAVNSNWSSVAFAKGSAPSAPSAASAPSAPSAASAPSTPSTASAQSAPSAPSTPSTASKPSGPDGFLEGEEAVNVDDQEEIILSIQAELRSDGLQAVSSNDLQSVLESFK